jgi:hypothetical protein
MTTVHLPRAMEALEMTTRMAMIEIKREMETSP